MSAAVPTRAIRRPEPGTAFWTGISTVLATAVLAASTQSFTPIAALLLLVATLLQVQVCRLGSGLKVPFVCIPIVVLNLVAFTGYVFYPGLQQTAAVSANLASNEGTYRLAVELFAVASLALTFGAVVLPKQRENTNASLSQLLPTIRIPQGVLFIAALLPLMLFILAYTPAGIISRARYDIHDGPSAAVTLSALTNAPGAVAAALGLFTARDFVMRTLSGTMLIAYFIVVFAAGSRALGVVILAVLIAWQLHIGATGRSASLRLIILTGLSAVEGVNVILALRGAQPAGLRPFLSVLANDPQTYLGFRASGVFGNILFSVPLTGTAGAAHVPWHSTLVGLTPLPSSFTDYYAVAPTA
jgi:hypothetical protein